MPLKKSKAFVLKKFKYGESSIIATLFSYEDGKFSAIIKGVRKLNSKYSGVFETLNNIAILYNKKENRDLQFISSAECINSYNGIKENLDKLNISYRICETINNAHYYYENNKDTYKLLELALNSLNDFSKNYDNIYIYFLLNLSKCTGHFIIDKYRFSETFGNEESLKYNEIIKNDLEMLEKINMKDLENYNIEENFSKKLIDILYNHLSESSVFPNKSNVNRAISQMKLKNE